jgi:hypothetical protein
MMRLVCLVKITEKTERRIRSEEEEGRLSCEGGGGDVTPRKFLEPPG